MKFIMSIIGILLAHNVYAGALSGGALSGGSNFGISSGGTNATSQVTNGVNYFDGTKITSGTALVWNGTNLGIGNTGTAPVDIWYGASSGAPGVPALLLGSDGSGSTARSTNSAKSGVVGYPTYSMTAGYPAQGLTFTADSSDNIVQIGGNSSNFRPTTQIKFYTSNAGVNGTGGTLAATIDTKQHFIFSGTAQSAGNLASCGTTPSITGNDVIGRITVGTGGATACVLTFTSAWTNAPTCTVFDETTSTLIRPTSSTTTVTLTASMAAADKIVYQCFGY